MLLWAQPLHQLANDEIEYVQVARDLLAGRGWSFYDHYHWLRAPLYPLFLAGSLWLTGGDLHLAALPNLALSVINVALVAALTASIANRKAALLAAVIMALLWTKVTFASLYMLETLFTFLFSAGLLLLVRGQLTLGRAITSGLLFGLAALTRSAVLPFLALAFIMLLWQTLHRRTHTLLPVIIWAISIALVIAPWTLRNIQAYDRPILIETGLSYNLWAFNEPRQSLDEIQAVLERIPNPAERSDYATAQGLQRLREDPLILARKIWPNWVFLARVKPIQDRFLQESYYSSIDLPLFSAALIFDDLLYVLIVLAAIWGLTLGRGRPGERQSRRVKEQQAQGVRNLEYVARRYVTSIQWFKLFCVGGNCGSSGACLSNLRIEASVSNQQIRQPANQASSRPVEQQSTNIPDSAGASLRAFQAHPAQAGPDDWEANNALRWISLIWLITVIVTILLTHGEARYRHFLFPVLIPYAAMALSRREASAQGNTQAGEYTSMKMVEPRELGAALDSPLSTTQQPSLHSKRHEPFSMHHSLLRILLSAIFLWTVITSYPHQWASENLARGWYTLVGDIARSTGQPQAAMSAYEQASNAQRAADPHLRLGDTARALNDSTSALEAYQSARRISPLYEASAAKLGDLLRAHGNDTAARAAFNADYLDQQRLVDWSWRELQPTARSFVDIGNGLDYGYISGVYPAEQQQSTSIRWTQAHARIRLSSPEATQLSLRLSAPHPDNALVPIALCIETRCTTVIASTEWRIIHMALRPQQAQSIIELYSPVFVGTDGRHLGVMLDWIRTP